jgi:phospholipid/cholesterol/gamma-HCH transport system substrate-binding protein
MSTRTPSAGHLLTMIAFTASCLGLLLFLWISFGGTTSLSPRGYEISAEFNQATELGSQADVRISGVDVGKVISVSLDRRTGLTRAIRPAPGRYPGDPASEDAPGRDLRRALARLG